MSRPLRTLGGGPPLTEQDVRRFERKYGFALPPAYRTFLLQGNGGRPERDVFPIQGLEGNPEGRIQLFFDLGGAIESCTLNWNLELFRERIPEDMIPIATTEGADFLCLAVSGDRAGAVFYYDGYSGWGQPNEVSRLQLLPLARSFGQFVEGLYRADDSPPFE